MIQFDSPTSIQTTIQKYHQSQKSIGLVPTMGALHDGHLSLIQRSITENDITIVSIFVNPTQFGPNEDFASYPRSLEADINHLKTLNGVHYLFTPSIQSLYPSGPDSSTVIHIPTLSKQYCGKSRPQFFDGVCSVVARLFQCTLPSVAYFGEKDFQQLQLIRRMVSDLFMPIRIIGCPIIRESNGLALSSRNQYLSKAEKKEAAYIYQMLKQGCLHYQSGKTNTPLLINEMSQYLTQNTAITIDYLDCVNENTLMHSSSATDQCRFIFAGTLGKTRLIDNMALSRNTQIDSYSQSLAS